MGAANVDILNKIFKDFWEWRLIEAPEFATASNVHTYNDKLRSVTLKAYEEKYDRSKEFLERLEKVQVDDLIGEDRLSYQQLHEMLTCLIDGFKWRKYGSLNLVNFLENTPINWSSVIVDSTRFNTANDFQMFANRLQEILRQTDEQIDLMKIAIAEKTTNHAVSMERIIEQYNEILSKPAEESVFYQPVVTKLPGVQELNEESRAEIATNIKNTIEIKVFEALKKERDFIKDVYLPNTRTGYGVDSLPNGKEYYSESLKWHLTVDMDPQKVHEIGLKEVSRIQNNMDDIKRKVNFSGSLKEFLQHMKENKDFYTDSKEKLLKEYVELIYEHIDPKLSSMFQKLPRNKIIVREMPFNGPGGMYFQPSTDGTRPGVFFANLNSPEDRTKFTMVSLALHEASPGHHFQLARQIESDLPSFRKECDWQFMSTAPFNFPIYTSFVEGWALYAEYLGEELGAYRDPYDMLGRYLDEILRAVRLVVDTGLHVLGWSREKAIDYMMEFSCDPREQIEIEIDRYITWPGQACGYKIGELKIKELRHRCEVELGSKFDIKLFHEVVLQSGTLSLNMLENVVEDWIRSQK